MESISTCVFTLRANTKRQSAAEKPSVQTVLEAFKVTVIHFLRQSLCQVFNKNKEPDVLQVHAASVVMGQLLSPQNTEIMFVFKMEVGNPFYNELDLILTGNSLA